MTRTRVTVAGHEGPALLPPNLEDMRQAAWQRAQQDPAFSGRLGSRPRPWSDVTGITLHQTASDPRESLVRWEALLAHVGISRRGRIYWCHDFNRRVYHAGGFNNRCVGVEVAGWYAGVEGDPRTLWQPKDGPPRTSMPLTDESVEAGKAAIRWICDRVARHGGQVRYLLAHRQSSGDRPSDPGSAIWSRIALPMIAELGLSDGGEGFAIDGGRPIPHEWDPSKAIHY